MGGTSTDVALIQNSKPRLRRETLVGDVRVKAPSVDTNCWCRRWINCLCTRINKSIEGWPESAGAVPGPAAYMKGGEQPTVCDANIVLGFAK